MLSDIQSRVRGAESPAIIPVGAGTKPSLAAHDTQAVEPISLREWSGITAYQASEFLISARSGTPMREVCQALDENQQYLPFDPLLVDAGSTLGGTVASGVSGPDQLLYGGLRDFVMEVEMIDGLGELVRGGGKVVKNAAGFDLPKLMVGSYGRLGILTEVTLKVLPRPEATLVMSAQLESWESAVRVTQTLLGEPLPIGGLDMGADLTIWLRCAGRQDSLSSVEARVRRLVPQAEWETPSTAPALELEAAMANGCLLRVAMDLPHAPGVAAVCDQLTEAKLLSITCGGNLAWIHTPSIESADTLGRALPETCSAVALSGSNDRLLTLGCNQWQKLSRRIQLAMDPRQRFVAFDEQQS